MTPELPPPTVKKMSKAERARQLQEQGYSYREIGDIVGMRRSDAWRACRVADNDSNYRKQLKEIRQDMEYIADLLRKILEVPADEMIARLESVRRLPRPRRTKKLKETTA